MESIFLILGVLLLCVFIVFNIWFFFARKEYRQAVENPYVWLEAMSLSVWKTVITLQGDLQDRRGLAQGWTEKIPHVLMYADLNQLAREGLIEQRPQLKEYGEDRIRVTILIYRLTPKGFNWSREQRNATSSESNYQEPQSA